MLFQQFQTQEERRACNGSDFFELQICKLPRTTDIKTITSIDSIRHWQNDSLYIGGESQNAFIEAYDGIFPHGVYNNLETGPIDPYGINYYGPDFIHPILTSLLKHHPPEYETLYEWLTTAQPYNGFYLLGV